MALIACPECGKMISDKASVCINCGFPLKNTSLDSINETDIPDSFSGVFDTSFDYSSIEDIEFSSYNDILPSVSQKVSNPNMCNILGKDYDFTKFLILLKKNKYYDALLFLLSDMDDGEFYRNNKEAFYYLIQYIDEFDAIPVSITLDDIENSSYIKDISAYMRIGTKWQEWQKNPALKMASKTGAIVCPKCGSAAISTGARGFSFTTGFIGASQTLNRCANCGYKWKPKRK